MKLGFFDSGLGGLLMMESCKKKYPNHQYVYLGDTKNLPYGPRSSEDIESFMSPYICYLLEDQNCDYVFIACNTASVRALPLFKRKYSHYTNKVIGIVKPSCDFLKSTLRSADELLVLGTQGTVASNLYRVLPKIQQVAMPGLVELIEENKKKEALVLVQDALTYYPNITHVLLGCTHYSWLKQDLKKYYPNIYFISQDIVLCNVLQNLLKKESIQKTSHYFVSSSSQEYIQKYNKNFIQIILKNND